MRLTHTIVAPIITDLNNCVYMEKEGFSHQAFVNKLGQLEDIEDELGIDLITLFKALKNGIWSKGGYYCPCMPTNNAHFIEPKKIEIGISWYDEQDSEEAYATFKQYRNELCFYEHEYEDKQYVVRVKDYGKTWALTKEELL